MQCIPADVQAKVAGAAAGYSVWRWLQIRHAKRACAIDYVLSSDGTICYGLALPAGVTLPRLGFRFRPAEAKRGAGLGSPAIYVDASNGDILEVEVPGKGTIGDVIVAAQLPIHSGELLGLPGRIIVCISGLVVAVLSVTGAVIWRKKRRHRVARHPSR